MPGYGISWEGNATGVAETDADAAAKFVTADNILAFKFSAPGVMDESGSAWRIGLSGRDEPPEVMADAAAGFTVDGARTFVLWPIPQVKPLAPLLCDLIPGYARDLSFSRSIRGRSKTPPALKLENRIFNQYTYTDGYIYNTYIHT